jgi:ABC-type oligopeptide transport system substrate-binding subunit
MLFGRLRAGGAPAGGAVVAIQADPGQPNPAIPTAGPVHQVAGALFSGLVALERDGTPQPAPAEGWQVSGEGLAARGFVVESGAGAPAGRTA